MKTITLSSIRWTALILALLTQSAIALEFSDLANEGEIKFLKIRPDPDAYRYESRVKITHQSLQNGVVTIATCHRQLDPIRKVEIVFNEERIKKIDVKSFSKMASATVQDNRVTLMAVQRGASICIDLESRALDPLSANEFKLNAGPLMRKYLDGYLPMSATLKVDWPANLLTLEKTNPAEQDGVKIYQSHSGAQLDLTFAGKMTAQIFLKKQSSE
jgi:hypothetical protein